MFLNFDRYATVCLAVAVLAGCGGSQVPIGVPQAIPAQSRVAPGSGQTGTSESVLYSFCTLSKCIDGAVAWSSLIEDKNGALYGTTLDGGVNTSCGIKIGCGAVFKLTPSGSAYTESILWSFGSKAGGYGPEAGLIRDKSGVLYGTTASGGSGQYGTVFRLTPSPSGNNYTESTLYSFCRLSNCADGAVPMADLIADANGALYGTTFGNVYSAGNVFKLTPSGTGYTENVLYSFCSLSRCADGANPRAGLIEGKNGALYGTTMQGGSSSSCTSGTKCGTVFKLTRQEKSYTERVLWSFNGGTDGDWPYSSLIQDASGALYGTTNLGGDPTHQCISGLPGCGTVFRLTPSRGKYTEKILWRFNGPDGSLPTSGLIAENGALYGTTPSGGSYSCPVEPGGCGTVFKLMLSGKNYAESVVWNFGNGKDGAWPDAGLISNASGTLYGTTLHGGASSCPLTPGCGTVFKVTP